jgi:DNA polymerase-4
MPTAQAYRICPDGVFLRGNYSLYSSLSKKVMEICNTFTPIVQQASIDEAYMDLAGTEKIYKDPSVSPCLRGSSTNPVLRNWPVGVAERLLRTIRTQMGLGATIGIGSNKLVARLAMQRAKPAGVCYVWPGYEAPFLATCELGEIPGIGRQTAEMLADYNLRTAGDVQKTDRKLLVATFGERFAGVLYEAAWGRGETHLELEYEQKSVSRDTSFERDTTDMNYIRSMLYYLTERACRTVRRMGQAAWTVSVKLRYSDFQTVGKSRTFTEPSNHDDVVYAVARDLLEKLYTRAVSVRLVGVHLSGLVSGQLVQLGLWELQQARRGRLYETSDRIRERFGFCSLMKGPAIELMGKMEQDAAGLKLRTSCLTK